MIITMWDSTLRDPERYVGKYKINTFVPSYTSDTWICAKNPERLNSRRQTFSGHKNPKYLLRAHIEFM